MTAFPHEECSVCRLCDEHECECVGCYECSSPTSTHAGATRPEWATGLVCPDCVARVAVELARCDWCRTQYEPGSAEAAQITRESCPACRCDVAGCGVQRAGESDLCHKHNWEAA